MKAGARKVSAVDSLSLRTACDSFGKPSTSIPQLNKFEEKVIGINGRTAFVEFVWQKCQGYGHLDLVSA